MEIENINVENITNQYMMFINKMKEDSIDIASEYLVMASELVHLKSKMLVNIKDDNDDEYEINSEEDLKEHLSKRIAEYKIPSRIIIYDELPMTANGKIDAKLLKEQVKER